MADIAFPRGVRDLLPNEALFRNELLRKIEDTFQLFGFLSIDTPSFESLKVLKAKSAIGSDSKLIYELKEEQLGLRYDMTMSLARYMAMHQELPLPFKRYYIGKVWRREEPQRLRYREITQADADIIGGNGPNANAEVIAVAARALEGMGLDYIVCVNDRKVIDGVLLKFGIPGSKLVEVMRSLDKLDKIGEQGVVGLLKGLELDSSIIDQVASFIALKGSDNTKLDYVDNLLGNGESTKDLRATLTLLKGYSLKGDIRVDFSTVRGLDYYTGIVFEYKSADDQSVSIAGGGRYDNLIGLFSPKQVPAVGVSFGVDRILEMMNYTSSTKYTYAKVFVANVNEKNYAYALKIANQLRSEGLPTDVNTASRNLSNQFAYASSIKTKYVAIVGDVEEKAGKVKLRNLISGKEEILSVDDAVKEIKGE
ncbi:MAG: histidine--tRNA ligase [Candidatus Micrarchaeaceae archaeon]|jgi:histidyl-tRNA synthetase